MKKVLIIGTVLICFLGCNTPKSDVQNFKQTPTGTQHEKSDIDIVVDIDKTIGFSPSH